ncbi:hypothetical protein SPONN_1607 [uncultured Candidatus Thioglobus sp.]|nr:hypothetical protein SPONN_1607 [uncultured Candidatus Thioglobus sp.]
MNHTIIASKKQLFMIIKAPNKSFHLTETVKELRSDNKISHSLHIEA